MQGENYEPLGIMFYLLEVKVYFFKSPFYPLRKKYQCVYIIQEETLPWFLFHLLKISISLQRLLIYFAIHTAHCKRNVKFSKLN